jgi:hypothetical protein
MNIHRPQADSDLLFFAWLLVALGIVLAASFVFAYLSIWGAQL